MVKRAIIVGAAMAALFCNSATAQDYRFSVDENRSDIFIRKDGGIDIEYVLTFTCASGAHPIDIVDVGLPNPHYRLNSVKAWLNGEQLSKIKKSEYIEVGVEVHLGSRTIRPGQTGTLQLTATNPRMVFPDDDDPDYASVEFYPTYYGSKYTIGKTGLQVAIHFPEGASGDEVKWHYQEFDEWGRDEDGRLTYIWRDPNASPSRQYKFGVSFPANLVDRVFEPKPWYSFLTEAAKNLRRWAAGCFYNPVVLIFIVAVIIKSISWMFRRRRMMKYMPPIASVEGAEIKRGLAAPEAALLLEAPLDKVMAMIVYGLVKKGAAEAVPGKRLRLNVIDPDVKLRAYEKNLLKALDPELSDDKYKDELIDVFRKMINALKARVKGFDVDKTRDYCRAVVSQAWRQVKESESTADVSKAIDERFDWLMLDKDMDDKFKDTLEEQQVRPPVWWPRYHPTSTWSHTRTSGDAFWVNGVDFADGVVSRIEGLADRAVSGFDSLVSDVTQITNPPPVRSYSSGGGGGCACACACAGCACACAGGGR
jgi:hypothetical protein